MFGLIISSRPVDATPQVISATQYAFKIPPAPSFSHIVLFLLPGAQLPPDTSAAVYVQIPPLQEFKLLGGIGVGKESAIFKVSGLRNGVGDAGVDNVDVDLMTDDSSTTTAAATEARYIVVGVSIEPAAQVESQLLSLKSQQSSQQSLRISTPSTAVIRTNASGGGGLATKVLARRIIGNAFNFLASFGGETVPLRAFQGWWEKFEKKIELDPGFLESGE